MCLVPVEFGTPQLAADDADRGDPLEFTPTTPTVPSPQPRELANRPADGDDLDVGDRPDDLEVHVASSLDRSRRTRRISRVLRPDCFVAPDSSSTVAAAAGGSSNHRSDYDYEATAHGPHQA